MITRKNIMTSTGAAGFAALLLLTGCSGTANGDEDTSGSPSATTAEESSATPGDQATDAATESADPGATEGASNEGDAAAGDDAAAGGEDAADPGAQAGRCESPELVGLLVPAEGGGSAGHTEVEVVLKNESPDECSLQGWPGVSFVGDDDGTQLGAAATFNRSSPHETVKLAPGESASAALSVSNTDNYGGECKEAAADGLRIYPPGEKRSVYVTNDQISLTACTNDDIELLQVDALQPAG